MICVCPKLIMYSHVLLITIMYFRGYRYIEYYLERFGWILQKIKFIVDIGTVQSYLEKWKKIVNFDNTVAKIARKSMRKKDDKWCNGGGRKNWISVMRLLKFLLPQVAPGAMLGGVLEREYELWQPSYWNCRVEERENMNCGNQVAKNGRKKNCDNQKKLWQWYCRNRGKKNCGNWFVVMAMATNFFIFLIFQQFHCHNFFGCHKICFFSHFQQLGRHNSYSLSSTPPSIAPRVAWGNKNFGNLITEIQFFLPPPSHHLSSLSLILFLAILATVLSKFTLFPHFPK